jgi:hypothetical protein
MRLVRLGCAFVSLVGVLAAAACGSFSSESSPDADASAEATAAEAAATDASPPGADAAILDAGDAGLVNLLANGDFTSGCGMWVGYQADLSPDPAGHTGSGCRVCSKGAIDAGDGFSINLAVPIPLVAGRTFKGEVWARAVDTDGGTTTKKQANAYLRTYVSSPANKVESSLGGGAQLDGNWQQLVVPTFTPMKVAPSLDFYVFVESTATAGSPVCFVVDDATVVQTAP